MARVTGFLTTIVLARTLGSAMFGVIAFALAVRLYLLVVVEGGIDSVGVREVASDPGFLRRVAPGVMLLRLVVAIALVLVVSVVAMLSLPAPDGAILAALSLTLLTFAVNPRWILLGLGQGGHLALGRVAGEMTLLVLVLITVHSGVDIAAVPLAQFVADAVAAAVLVRAINAVLGPLRWREGLSAATGILREAAPLTGHAFLGLVMFNADILMLRVFHGALAVGMYAAAYTPISFCLNLGVTFYQSLLPSLSRLTDPGAMAVIYQRGIRQVLLAGIPIAVGGVFLARQGITLVFGQEYGPGATALAILAVSVPLSLLRNVGQAAIVARRRQDLMFKISAGCAIVNVMGNVACIPPFGLTGAAVVTAGTELLRTTLTLRFARGLGLIPRVLRAAVLPVVAGGGMAVVLWMVGDLPVIIAAILGTVVYGLIIAAGSAMDPRRKGQP